MSVAEIAQLHSRYVRLSDRFKAVWTYNQFAAGVFKNFLRQPIPYEFDFQKLYEGIRRAGDTIQTAAPANAIQLMDRCDRDLQHAYTILLDADDAVGASILRRFFEKLRRQDEKIIFNLLKFYIYAGATRGEQRDKLDFLFTQLAEDFIEERGEFAARDAVELKKHFQGLISGVHLSLPPQAELSNVIHEFRAIKEDVVRCQTFEELTANNLTARSRELKHRIGDEFLHPDVLIAITDCNIAMKNRFAKLYRDEESRIVEDARRLVENEQAIARGFGEHNPDLLDELGRFKRFKQEFDDSRANSNVKAGMITQLKMSMSTILAQLDRDLDQGGEVEELPESLLLTNEQDELHARLVDDPVLQPYLERIVAVLDSFDRDETFRTISSSPSTKSLRLEPWEVNAFEKLYWNRILVPGETKELMELYLKAAALRIKSDEEARELADLRPGEQPSANLLTRVQQSLDRAKQFDDLFRTFLSEGMYSNPKNLHRLYRSRLRLMRGFSGLWLIYDQFAEHD
jgi:hypothetical protein